MRLRLSKSVVQPFVAIVVMAGMGIAFVPAANAQSAAEKAFVATGDAICRKSNVRLAEQALKFERHTLIERKTASSVTLRVAKPADVAEFIKKVASKELRTQLDELGELTPPKSQDLQFGQALKEAESAFAKMTAKPEESAFANPFSKSGKMFSALGFKSCGQPEGRSSSV